MEGNYAAMFGGKPVGTVQVTRQGLYYRFVCNCRLSGGVVCRLLLLRGGQRQSIGVLVPQEEGFGLDAKLAIKKCGQGPGEFLVVPSRDTVQGKFVPISPEEPFAYIQRLKDAFLERRNGEVGVVLLGNTPGE